MNAVCRTVLYLTICGAIGLAANDKALPNSHSSITTNTLLSTSAVAENSASMVALKITTIPATTPKPPATTPEPPATTSEPPVTTPEAPVTTPEPPVTTPEPPAEGSWVVKDDNLTCIRALLKIKFTIDVDDKQININLSPKANATGSCNASETTQVLVLSYDNYALMFEFEKNSTNTYVKNITFDLLSMQEIETFYNDTKMFIVPAGKSYLCQSNEMIYMGNVTMQVLYSHLQAFGTKDEKDFSEAEECEADDDISDIVPIAVACALAALIVVVLIAYLVGRRRNRQRGYTSV